ncbi:MAG: helix-turn-helix domain-containing protein [Lachnospiraceae bacterium]|nr:helix-turn-helix domain-containing protein [Lachnospiraceae bacterium]
MDKKYVIRKTIGKDDIKQLRRLLHMTQKEFAIFVGVSKRTVEHWESLEGEITGPIVTLVELLSRKPELAEKLELPEKKLKLRLHYMYKNLLCTIIDVDEPARKVEIRNYTDSPLYRAFGVNTEPSFEEYEAFLESRCFPRTRDKIKLELKRLDIPFYDPIMIIEKTEGRMAEDDFWIRLER